MASVTVSFLCSRAIVDLRFFFFFLETDPRYDIREACFIALRCLCHEFVGMHVMVHTKVNRWTNAITQLLNMLLHFSTHYVVLGDNILHKKCPFQHCSVFPVDASRAYIATDWYLGSAFKMSDRIMRITYTCRKLAFAVCWKAESGVKKVLVHWRGFIARSF